MKFREEKRELRGEERVCESTLSSRKVTKRQTI